LTIKGRIAIKLNLHLGFKRVIPKRLKKIMRKLREQVLTRKIKEQIIKDDDN
jgi:hypothetical protein